MDKAEKISWFKMVSFTLFILIIVSLILILPIKLI